MVELFSLAIFWRSERLSTKNVGANAKLKVTLCHCFAKKSSIGSVIDLLRTRRSLNFSVYEERCEFKVNFMGYFVGHLPIKARLSFQI